MAVELCSEGCAVSSSMSPRISFSHDFSQSDVIPVEQHPLRSNSSGLNNSGNDFDFCVGESFQLESSSADELFSDGRIIPTEIKRKNAPMKLTNQSAPQPSLPSPNTVRENASKKENPKESKYLNDEVCDKQSSKSFWGFKRSSSYGNGYGRSLCPLPLLSRSNSTGSTTPNVKRNIPLSKEGHNPNIKQNSQKHSSTKSYQKPPLKKSHGSYGNSVRVNPVLNVPSANLFGLGSIFSNSRDKIKKK